MHRFKFAELAVGEHFYFIDELLTLKRNRCTKTGAHSFKDAAGEHAILRTWRPVFGPVTVVGDSLT